MKNVLIFSLFLLTLAYCKKDDDADDPSERCEATATEILLATEISDQFAYIFNGADPTVTDDQIDPLLDYLATAKIVGLGEATHGTKEFYQMKDKIFRSLVTEKDFKAIIFEIPWGNAMVVNNFVQNGIGSADESINQTFYWTYDTQEVRDLAQWMHDYNANLTPEEKILFVGCDPQGGNFHQERAIIVQFLEMVEPDSIVSTVQYYAQLPGANLFDYKDAAPQVHQDNIQGTNAVYDFLSANRDAYVAASSEFEYEVALMAAHVIKSREELYRIGDTGVPRDELMAFYTEWWQRILGPQSKVAVWAHNYHVMDGSVINASWMGTELRQRNGSDYKNVAFSFGEGSFNAFVAGADQGFQSGVQRQIIPEIPCRTVNQVLSMVDGDAHYLILEELEGDTRAYLEQSQPFVQLGAGFNYEYINNYKRELPLARLFDVLIHFDRTNESDLR